MSEESPLLLPPVEESPEPGTEPAGVFEPGLAEPIPEPDIKPAFICECEEWMRSACKDEPFYKEHEGKRYCVLHYPSKEKAADFNAVFRKKLAPDAKDFDFHGVWFPEDVDFNGFEFSAAVIFRYATFSAEVDFNSATFSAEVDFNFATFNAGASFNFATFSAGASFSYATFSAAAYFNEATFSAAAYFNDTTFSTAANFYNVTFSAEVGFNSATFSAEAEFRSATFNAVTYFNDATFSAEAYFYSATFSAAVYFNDVTFSAVAVFRYATFSAETSFNDAAFRSVANFYNATFKDQIDFSGNKSFGRQSAVDLQFTRIEKPERVVFRTLMLRPYWFVNVDPCKFVFTDVSWNWQVIGSKSEIQSLEAKEIDSPRRLLAIACRQLAENAETNNRYEEASHFRYWAMDLAWCHKWAGWRFWETDWLHILYWAVSGYGERILRAFACLVGVCIFFALLYMQTGFTKPEDRSATPAPNSVVTTEPDTIGQPLPLKRAFTYSLAVMSLQKPEPKPLTGTAQTLVLFETILGPLQAALLALAIRRKFMR